MNVIGNTRIFMRKVGTGKKQFTRFSVSVGRKDAEGNWINATMFANLSDKAKSFIKKNKDKITKGDSYQYIDLHVDDGWLTAREAKDEDEYNTVVLFFNKLSLAKNSRDTVPDIDMEDEDDTPF